MVIRELQAGESSLAYLAMLALRPHVGTEAEFAERVDRIQRPENYRLVASFEGDDEQAAAVAGFRTYHMLASGYTFYCDDLSTRPEYRRRGHGRALLGWMLDEAVRLGCEQFHLDSGVGPDRTSAHRLYLNFGMRISSHHFLRLVSK